MAAPQMQTAGGNRPFATNQNTDATDFNAANKDEANVIARLAFGGHVVHRGRCNDFTVSKWGLSFYASDLDALRAFARRLGVL